MTTSAQFNEFSLTCCAVEAGWCSLTGDICDSDLCPKESGEIDEYCRKMEEEGYWEHRLDQQREKEVGL